MRYVITSDESLEVLQEQREKREAEEAKKGKKNKGHREKGYHQRYRTSRRHATINL